MNNVAGDKFQWGLFGEKSLDYLTNSTAFLNLAVGAIRSGKTIIGLVAFLKHVLNSPNTHFIMAGNTINSLKRNVIDVFTEMLEAEGIPYKLNMGTHMLDVAGNSIALYGLDKEGSDKKIRGYTSGGAFVDEITTMPQSSFEMLLSRNSLPGSRVYATCNPVSPLNYVYTEYVSNKRLIRDGYVKVWNFTLDDNLTLTNEYIETLKNIYPAESVFYKRNILGQWVSGQGIIFDKFTRNNIINEDHPMEYYDYLEVGSDYGTTTTTCYQLVGVKEYDDHNEYTLIDEYGYNAQQEGQAQTDAQRVEDIIAFQNKYGLGADNTFYCSHDAGSLKAALQRDPRVYMQIQSYMPDTLKCIQMISSLFYKNQLLVHARCKETIKEIYGYEWDTRRAERGIDAPIKEDDHYIDAMRAPIMNHLYVNRGELSRLVYI